MIRRLGRIVWLPAFSVAIGGCATVDPRLDYEQARQHINRATGQNQVYQPGDDKHAASLIEEMLRGGITVDEAVKVALLNNLTLQAEFLNIGMARADVVQAGLLSNPSLGISARLPSGGGRANIEGGLAQNIADLWQIPPRKRAAQRSLDQTILDIARRAADLAGEARIAYYGAVGADERRRIADENLTIAQNLLELTLARQEAGGANELDVNLSRSLALDAELDLEAVRLAASDARRALATLLGLTSDADELKLLDALPDILPEAPDAEQLLGLARRNRLDIRAAEQAVSAAQARLTEQRRLVFPVVELGIEFEREERRSQGGRNILADTARASVANGRLTAPGIQPRSEQRGGHGRAVIVGPSIGLQLPIFDQNQAQIAKAQYACQQVRKMLDALDRAVAHEVRGAVDRVSTAWKLAQTYSERSIPLAQSNLDLSREAYSAGRASFLSVLEAQRFFLNTRSGYVNAAQTAAIAIPELELAIGLPFASIVDEVNAAAASEPNAREDERP